VVIEHAQAHLAGLDVLEELRRHLSRDPREQEDHDRNEEPRDRGTCRAEHPVHEPQE
jgi:hypothetical protein